MTIPEQPSAAVVRLAGTIAIDARDRGTDCRRLDIDGNRAYVLVSTDARLVTGARVTVDGRRSPALKTPCRGATPFVVTEVISVEPAQPRRSSATTSPNNPSNSEANQ